MFRRRDHHHTDPAHDHDDDHDRGLQHDVATLLGRRRALAVVGGAGLVGLAACIPETGGSGTTTTTAAGGGTTTTTSTGSTCAVIPAETNGPYPADNSNGKNVLNQSGIVRSDIRSSFGSSTTTAPGTDLDLVLRVVDTASGCTPLVGAAVYVWHCDAVGRYSMYSSGVTGENYLRGVQETDADGVVRFSSVFPGAYAGRWPHVHFEVYPSVSAATSASNKLRTSQLALPEDVCRTVYARSEYGNSTSNLNGITLASDNVFSDGYSLQMATVTGSIGNDLTATLTVPV